jgi:hypothetical protein
MNDEIQDIQTGRKPQILIKKTNKKNENRTIDCQGVKHHLTDKNLK